MINRSLGAEIFHADRHTDGKTEGQSDMTKQIVASRNVAKAYNTVSTFGKINHLQTKINLNYMWRFYLHGAVVTAGLDYANQYREIIAVFFRSIQSI